MIDPELENKILLEGSKVAALALDPHVKHIEEHVKLLKQDDLGSDVVDIILEHINQHQDLLVSVDKDLLLLFSI